MCIKDQFWPPSEQIHIYIFCAFIQAYHQIQMQVFVREKIYSISLIYIADALNMVKMKVVPESKCLCFCVEE